MGKNNAARFPVFHVPHDGEVFPPELLQAVCVPMELFLRYHDEMRDAGAREMVPQLYRNEEHAVIFPVSRLLCDVERFLGPEEPMERYGMGFCYERVYDGTRIKAVTEELKQRTLRYYREHHARLDALCALHPRLLLLDLHSFSDAIVPKAQLHPGMETPDVCLGVDTRFTPEALAATAEQILREAGFSTARNYPYAGSMVPNAVLNRNVDCNCISLMLEWNRRAYCCDAGTPDPEKLARIRTTIEQIAVEYEKDGKNKKVHDLWTTGFSQRGILY